MTTGFKVLPQNAVLDILKEQIQSVGYVFQIEVNIKCKIKGYNLTEIPIIFVDRQHGKSKLNLKIIYEALRLIFKWKFQYRLNEAE
jgi:dolichol-phosphate mannosyltransferase